MKTRVIVCLLVVFLFSCGVGVAVADDGFIEFRDTEGYWAAETIARTSALGLVRGYADGTFRPREQVTRQELVVMVVRTLGLEAEAEQVDAAALGYSQPDVGPWAEGAVVLATHKRWISSNLTEMNFRVPASRLDVAMIVARALDLSSDNALITFADLEQIPDSYRPYVAAVVREGIMGGVPGNLFEPWRGVTRAEMTSMITRILDAGLADPYPGRQFVAELRAAAGDAVDLRTIAGERTYYLADFHLIYRENQKVSLGSLRIGDNVRVVLDGGNKVRFLAHTSAAVAGTPSDEAGSDYTGGTSGSKAYVINTYRDLVSVRYDNGTQEMLDIYNSTRFYLGNRLTNYSAVDRGARVELVRSGSGVVEMRVLDEPYKIFGEVVRAPSYVTITVRDGDGQRVSLDFADRVTVRDADGYRLDVDDISRDDRVELQLDDDGLVDAVTLDSRQGDQDGVVTQIRTGYTPRITVEDNKGGEYSYFIRDDVLVTKDNETLRLRDVEEGDEVRLWLDRYDDVVEIEVLQKDIGREYWGTVIKLDLSKEELTIQRGTRTVKYDLDRDVSVRRDGETLWLDEVLIGAEVELTVAGDRVISIEVTEDRNIWVEGKIVRIDEQRERLTIEQENGAVFWFDFASDAYLRDDDGSSMGIDDLRTGRKVELGLRDGEIRRLYLI